MPFLSKPRSVTNETGKQVGGRGSSTLRFWMLRLEAEEWGSRDVRRDSHLALINTRLKRNHAKFAGIINAMNLDRMRLPSRNRHTYILYCF